MPVSNQETAWLVKSLSERLPLCCKNIYQPAKGWITIRFRSGFLWIKLGSCMFWDQAPKIMPDKPSGLACKLRRHLRNTWLLGCSKVPESRAVMLEFGYKQQVNIKLVIELFGSGYCALLDMENKIIFTPCRYPGMKAGDSYQDRIPDGVSETIDEPIPRGLDSLISSKFPINKTPAIQVKKVKRKKKHDKIAHIKATQGKKLKGLEARYRAETSLLERMEENPGDFSVLKGKFFKPDKDETWHRSMNRFYAIHKSTGIKVEKTKAGIEQAIKRLKNQTEMVERQWKGSWGTGDAWFETFHWYLDSNNIMVVWGRNADQNEILVKRYLREGDIYIHSTAHGAPSCIVRAREYRQESGIPHATIESAASLCQAFTKEWGSGGSAWWVEANQVSKTPPSGQYLSKGSIIIRGKRNLVRVKDSVVQISIVMVDTTDRPTHSPDGKMRFMIAPKVMIAPHIWRTKLVRHHGKAKKEKTSRMLLERANMTLKSVGLMPGKMDQSIVLVRTLPWPCRILK